MSTQNGGKCFRRVHYVLDEFGNLPTVNSMNTKISIGLGQEISFDIVVQNDEQLSDKYDEKVANTIKANCSNTMYILSNDDKTTELISKKIGKTTVMTRNHSITPDLSVGRDTINTSQTSQDVITPSELQHLMVGEQILLRANTRQSIYGSKIRNNPIFARGLTYEMPSRWQFLQDTFDTNTIMSDIPLKCLHAKMNLQDNAYTYFNNGSNYSESNELDKMNKMAGLSDNNKSNDLNDFFDKFNNKINDKRKALIDEKTLESDKKYRTENMSQSPLLTEKEVSDDSILTSLLYKIYKLDNDNGSRLSSEYFGDLDSKDRIEFIKENNNLDFWNDYGINRETLNLDN